MIASKRHKVITVARGTDAEGRAGYAARCETEGCGAITFGGFPSRSAARAELAGHEEAPEAVAAARGEDQNTHFEGERSMSDSTNADQPVSARTESAAHDCPMPSWATERHTEIDAELVSDRHRYEDGRFTVALDRPHPDDGECETHDDNLDLTWVTRWSGSEMEEVAYLGVLLSDLPELIEVLQRAQTVMQDAPRVIRRPRSVDEAILAVEP